MRNWLKLETVIVLLGIPIVFFTFINETVSDKWWNTFPWKHLFFIFYLIILTIIFFPLLKLIYGKIKFWIGLEVIINYQNAHLEFLDSNGDEAYFSEENQFKKIKKKVRTSGTIDVDGKIKNKIYTYNCHSVINDKENKVEIVYGIFQNGNNPQSITNNQKYFGYALTVKNSFPSEKEYWAIKSIHYTKVYDMKISFYNDNPPRDVYIKEIFRDKNGKVVESKSKELISNALIIKKYNRTIIKTKLLDLKKGKEFEVWWTWEKKKNLVNTKIQS